MSTLRVDNIQLNQEGNASISIANSYNVVFTTDGIERVKISKDGFNLAGTGALKVPAGNTAVRPAVPEPGQVRYNTTTGKFEGYGAKWAAIGSGAEIGDAAPSNSGSGDLWWNSSDGKMYIYYVDANSSQWVDISAGTGGQYLPLTGGDVSGNVSVSGAFGVGTIPTISRGTLQVIRSGVSGGNPANTGSTDANQIATVGNENISLRFGIYLNGSFWLQPSAITNYATNYNTIINPNGGNVGIGTDLPTAKLSVNGDLAFNSGYGSAAVAYGCRAWVNFNGTGTVAIRAAGNVTSITDNGAGDYTVNFTTALVDVNYAAVTTATGVALVARTFDDGTSRTTTLLRVTCFNAQTFNGTDATTYQVAVFR